jgi:hypothetical protein
MRKLHALLLTVLITITFGTVYGVAQQYGRSAANDAPAVLAESIAAQLNIGTAPSQLTTQRLNVATTFSPFFVVYTPSGKPVAGNGYLDNRLARMNTGVLEHAKVDAYHAVTWEPRSDVRIASVTTATSRYYVVAGQSLKRVEARDSELFKLVELGWAMSMLCVGIGYLLLTSRIGSAVNRRGKK